MANGQGIDLDGTRVLVTGGNSGLGLAMATALARAGAAVVLTSRSAERAAATAAQLPGAAGIAADARDEAAVARAVEQAWARLDGIDLLVNNAGLRMKTINPRFMIEPQGFWQVPAGGFLAVLDTNLTGYFLMAREVTPRMLDAGGPRCLAGLPDGAQGVRGRPASPALKAHGGGRTQRLADPDPAFG